MNNTQANDTLRNRQSTDLELGIWSERKQFDTALAELYKERNWWIFTMGEAWFNRQAERYHQKWTESGTPFRPDNDYAIDRICWETDPENPHRPGVE
jgi:hypothetical protein